MKRKITTILLALALCLTLLPVGAGAVDTPSGTALTSDLISTLSPEDYSYFGTDNACYVLNGGTYYLDSDVTIDKPLLIKGTEDNPTTLDLKGHVLEYSNSATNGSVIIVNDGAHFVLQDTFDSSKPEFTRNLKSKPVSLENSTAYNYETNTSTYWQSTIYVIDDSGTDGTVTGGVITGGTGIKWTSRRYNIVFPFDFIGTYDDFFGGGVYVGSAATFEMTGGNIVGCTATQSGGGVAICRGTAGNETFFTMTGGRIVGCTALVGGGVHADGDESSGKTSIFNLAGGTIQNCTAGQSGGGVYVMGQFIMSGNSTIENCTAKTVDGLGGGVATGNIHAAFTMEDGTIKNCTADKSGGGVYHQNGTFTMEGGTIQNCTAVQKGGGVYINGYGYGYGTLIPTMDAQGGSVDGGVDIYGVDDWAYGKLKNTSTEGSTIFYAKDGKAIVKEGVNATIEGKLVKFMNGETLYAETVAKDGNAKISQPVAPEAAEGKRFDGWYTGETGGTKWDFDNAIGDTETLYAVWKAAAKAHIRTSGAPTISAVLTHPDAASATNYNSGIYGLTFRSTASFSSFRGVQVDGKTIASSNYIAEEGSIVVYLKAVYLQTLSKGLHTVTILSTEGNATMDFTIGGIQSPKTADAGVAIYALMALTSCTGTALVVRGRKRK